MTVVNHWGRWVSDNIPVTGVISLNSLEHIHDLCTGSNVIDLTYEEGWKEFQRDKMREAESGGLLQPVDITSIRRCDPAEVADYWVLYGEDWIATSSDDPSHPQGVWGFDEVSDWSKWVRDLGNEAKWDDLPLTLRCFLQDQFGMFVEPTEELIEEWQEEYNELDQPPSDLLIGVWVQGDNGKYEPGELTEELEFAAIVRFDSNVAQVVKSKWVRSGELCSPCYPGQVDLDEPGQFLGYDFPQWVYGELGQNSANQEERRSHVDMGSV